MTSPRSAAGPRAPQPTAPGFLRALVHDLRSPITLARRLLDELQDGPVSPHMRARLLAELADCLETIDEVAEEALGVERFDDEIARSVAGSVDVVDVVRETLVEADLLETPDLHVDGGPHVVVGHRWAIELAVRELLSNAADHTPLGTPVHVRLRGGGTWVEIVVEDEGPGVPDDLKERIFEPYERGGAPPTRGGLGLGLAKVARVAQVHDGRTWVEDVPTGGASFRLSMPSDGAASSGGSG